MRTCPRSWYTSDLDEYGGGPGVTFISLIFTLLPESVTMRFANLNGRSVLLTHDGSVDVEKASGGLFPADPQALFADWCDFVGWANTAADLRPEPFEPQSLGSPAPRPGQVFAIGLNYADHAVEAGFVPPDTVPPVFTKFPSCITGPYGDIQLPPDGHTDWETELVVIIGQRAERVREEDAWRYVAGLSVGQDLSERRSQMAGPSPQFSLAKSFPRFGPIGPCMVTVDEVANPDDLMITTTLNGETVQRARTNQLIFDVSTIIARLSAVALLMPGDVIFTGTPAGVGMGRTPPRWLANGDELVSSIEGIGQLQHRFVS